jgi:hypothetical protein
MPEYIWIGAFRSDLFRASPQDRAARPSAPVLSQFFRVDLDTLCFAAHAVHVEIYFRIPLPRGKLGLVRNLLTVCTVSFAVYSSVFRK